MIFNLEPASDRVIVIDSLSKRFSLCGARVGCLISANEEVLASALKIAQARLAAPTMSQFASAHMLENIKDDFLQGVINEFRMRRDALYAALKEIPGVIAQKPQGAFYTYSNIEKTKMSSDFPITARRPLSPRPQDFICGIPRGRSRPE